MFNLYQLYQTVDDGYSGFDLKQRVQDSHNTEIRYSNKNPKVHSRVGDDILNVAIVNERIFICNSKVPETIVIFKQKTHI